MVSQSTIEADQRAGGASGRPCGRGYLFGPGEKADRPPVRRRDDGGAGRKRTARSKVAGDLSGPSVAGRKKILRVSLTPMPPFLPVCTVYNTARPDVTKT